LIRLTTSEGLIGYGNIDPTPGYSVNSVDDHLEVLRRRITPILLGRDPTNINSILDAIDESIVGYLDSRAAAEMACIDISAQAASLSIHAYLGGAVKTNLLFNAWIGTVSPDQASREAAEWKARGFLSAKVKTGGDLATDWARVKAVRDTVGPDFVLRVDANGAYRADAAVELVRRLAPLNLQLLEQPTPAEDISALALVRLAAKAEGIPIMADESVTDHESLIRIIKAEAADMIKVKVAKQGGMLAAQKMIATAKAAGMSCVLGSGFGLGISTMAEIIVASTANSVMDGLECVGPLKIMDDILKDRIDLSSGAMRLPAGTGYGVVVDGCKLARYSVQ
jgi:muconate cycloisomerase